MAVGTHVRSCESKLAIFCVTPENIASPWLHTEVGAFLRDENSRHLIYLLGLRNKELPGSLSELQTTEATEDDTA